MKTIKKLGYWLIISLPFVFIIGVITFYSYTQRYIKHNQYAEKGIWFTNSIDLDKHKLIGNGSTLFGKYEAYSRSDRQEFIKVYIDTKEK